LRREPGSAAVEDLDLDADRPVDHVTAIVLLGSR